MARLRLTGKPVYLPDMAWENVVRLHAAVDGETGHVICHHYPLGVTLIQVGDMPVPALAVSDCTLLVLGEAGVEALVSHCEPAALEEVDDEHAVIGGIRVDAQSVAMALASLRDTRSKTRFYTARIDVDGSERPAAIVTFKNPEGEGAWALLVIDCREKEERKGDGFYI